MPKDKTQEGEIDLATGEPIVKRTRRVVPRDYFVSYAGDDGRPTNLGPFTNPEYALGFIAGTESINPDAFNGAAQVVEVAQKVYTGKAGK